MAKATETQCIKRRMRRWKAGWVEGMGLEWLSVRPKEIEPKKWKNRKKNKQEEGKIRERGVSYLFLVYLKIQSIIQIMGVVLKMK